ncbi:MAG: thiamine ABC transporter substrate-binding protein [Candidatus Nanopelagicales bacterium]
MKRIPLVPVAALSATAIVLSGCATQSEDAETVSDAGRVTVQLLTHDSFALSEDLIAEFEDSSGIDLELVSGGDAGSMVAGAILAAGAPTADVMFGVDNTLVTRTVDEGVFEPYTSTEVAQLRPELADQTFDGRVTPIDFGDVCINIDDTWFAGAGIDPPRTLEDLTAPTYQDLTVVQDPGTSSPGLAFLLSTVSRFGDAWPDYWQRLRDNGVKVSGSWSDAYYGDFTFGGGGDRPIVVSYATSPPAEIVYAEGEPPAHPSTSVMTDGCYRQIEFAGILAGTDQPEAAAQVIDWLLSPEVQADIPLNMFVFPARQGTPLPEVFTKFAGQVDDAEQLPADFVAENLADLLAEWGSVMGR